MTKEFCILLLLLLLTGFGTAVVIFVHDDDNRKNPYDDVEQIIRLELKKNALRFFRQKDLYEAENHLRKLLKIDPENREMQLLYGRILLETGRNEDAERTFRRMASANPLDYGARNNIGVAMLLAHKYEAALQEFTLISRNGGGQRYVGINIAAAQRAIELSNAEKKFSISVNSDVTVNRDPGIITTSIVELQEKTSK